MNPTILNSQRPLRPKQESTNGSCPEVLVKFNIVASYLIVVLCLVIIGTSKPKETTMTTNTSVSLITKVTKSTTKTTQVITYTTGPRIPDIITTTPKTVSCPGCTKLVVMNSIDPSTSQRAQVIDLSSEHTWCNDLMKYPIITRGTHGGLLPNGTPIVCGGQDSNRCFIYDISDWNPNPGWEETFPMSIPRMHFVGMSGSPYRNLSHKYFVIGGGSAEVLTDEGWEIIGPTPPSPFYTGCLMIINETSVLVLEGQYPGVRDTSSFTYILNTEMNWWVQGPSLLYARNSAGCGLVRESQNSQRNVFIISGGMGLGSATTELLKDVNEKWYQGRAPFSNILASQPMAQYHSGGIVAVLKDYIFVMYLATADSSWQIINSDVKARDWITSFFVPDQAVRCYSKNVTYPAAYKLH